MSFPGREDEIALRRETLRPEAPETLFESGSRLNRCWRMESCRGNAPRAGGRRSAPGAGAVCRGCGAANARSRYFLLAAASARDSVAAILGRIRGRGHLRHVGFRHAGRQYGVAASAGSGAQAGAAAGIEIEGVRTREVLDAIFREGAGTEVIRPSQMLLVATAALAIPLAMIAGLEPRIRAGVSRGAGARVRGCSSRWCSARRVLSASGARRRNPSCWFKDRGCVR